MCWYGRPLKKSTNYSYNAKAGLDFDSVADAIVALKAEIEEFLTAYKNGDKQEIEKEIGDVLFSAVNVGRKADCDTEKALKESAERFAKRFTIAEKLALADGEIVTELSVEEWDYYYRMAKSKIEKDEAENA